MSTERGTAGAAPDRYGDAVRARRVELRAEQGRLSGPHRGELRAELTLARIVAADTVAAVFAELAGQAAAHVAHPAPTVRRALLATLPAVLDTAAERVHETTLFALAPALRRIATARRLEVGLGWPVLPPPRRAVVGASPARLRAPRLAGAAEGLAVWRVALVALAAMPLVGLPVLGGPALAPVAVGLGVAAVTVAVWSRRACVERLVVQRQVDAVLAQGRAAVRVDVERMLLDLERAVAAELDAAVERRRGEVEAELLALAGPRAVARV